MNPDARPLLITADSILVDHIRGLAAAGGLGIDVLEDPRLVAPHWQSHALVLVGGDLADQLRDLPRRRDVAVVRWQFAEHDDIPGSTWQAALAMGAEHVVALPEGDRWLADRLTDLAPEESGRGRVLAVTGACGGAGASTLAVGLALAAQRSGHRVLLIDGDLAGGGLDLLLGAEGLPGARWPELMQASGRMSAETLLPALPHASGISLISAARTSHAQPSAEAWHAILEFGARAFELMILDLPRACLLAPRHSWLPADGGSLWCVVPTRIRAIAAAAATLESLRASGCPTSVVTRQHDRSITAADVTRALSTTVRASLPDDASVAGAAEQGLPPAGAYARVCASLITEFLAP